MTPLFIPSPPQGVWYLGPLPIRAYALCVLTGIVVAVLLARRRWRGFGGDTDIAENILLVTALCGIVGARLYYVVMEWPQYFGPDGVWYHIFFVWEGGLGIMGGVTVGALACWLACRHYQVSFAVMADCLAPAIPIGQAIGRFGNWFNQELYGRPTTLPWGLEIDAAHRVAGYAGYETYHPTFLYESVLDLVLAAVLLTLGERAFKLGRGKLFALYLAGYAGVRVTVESFRIDPVPFLGPLRFNMWSALLLGLAGLTLLAVLLKTRPGPNAAGAAAGPEKAAEGEAGDGDAGDDADVAAEDHADDAEDTDDADEAEAAGPGESASREGSESPASAG